MTSLYDIADMIYGPIFWFHDERFILEEYGFAHSIARVRRSIANGYSNFDIV